MSLLLLIETSTEICSVALSQDGQQLAIRESDAPYVHAEKITCFIEECMAEANKSLEELSAVALSKGPGSYTGLRVGASAAKGICYALNKPLLAIDTLEALADACRRQYPQTDAIYCPMIDARRMEVYTALYDHEGNCLQAAHAHILTETSFADYQAQGRQLIGCGNGARKAKQVLPETFLTLRSPNCSASHLIPLAQRDLEGGQKVDPAYFSPQYIKPPNITKSRKIL
ncbi:MAG: tRNA (adenosine(37)-N6)-threonylcarbamoyltransferase complex dimerization subunit type 1 TsaB [Bacteroidota bacterium]